MSLARKQALISGGAWLVITVALFITFFNAGPEGFTSDENRGARIATAAIILPGYVLNFGILFWSRRGRGRGDLDERDTVVERKATEVAFIVVLIFFFITCIWLFELYREVGAVPVGWLYLLAYGTVAVVSVLHPMFTLVFDYLGTDDG